MEIPQLQCVDKVVDNPEAPQVQVSEKTVEISQLQAAEKIVDTRETQTIQGIQTSESLVHLTGAMKPDNPDARIKFLAEEELCGVGGPVFDANGNRVANELRGQNCVTGEMWKNEPPFNLSLNQATSDDIAWQRKKYTGRGIRKLQESGTALAEGTEAPVPKMPDSIEAHCQASLKSAKDPQTQETVKEIRSKFEVGHTKGTEKSAHARNQPDKNRWRKKQEFEATQYPQDAQERADLTNQRHVLAIRNAHKTVEVPRVQYIDKVAHIPVHMQRQVSTLQAGQHIDEVEDVPALTQSEVPNILDDDEDQPEQESKKRKLPMPAEAISESHADESDFDRFEDLVLPSPEGKTLFVSIASGDEAEDESDKEQEMTQSLVQGEESMLVDETDAQGPEHKMVQVVHTEWSQESREVQRKFADDMTDVKNDLAHVREMLGVLVRRERSAETKAEIAARRLDRMEREHHEADDAEHEVNLQEALANQSKAVKVLVDKWFVDKDYGFGKAPTGEIVFIHASAVQGAEVLTIGTDAWVQVVSDDARAQGRVSSKESLGAKRVEGREGQRMRTKWPNK